MNQGLFYCWTILKNSLQQYFNPPNTFLSFSSPRAWDNGDELVAETPMYAE